jgi:carboxypeptidase Taq
MTKIDELVEQLKTFAKYGSALAVLGWDEEVNLPVKASAYRGEVNALLSSDLHKKFTDDDFYKLVNELTEASDSLSEDQKVIVRETKRDVTQARKLPSAFVEEMALLTTKAFSAWVEARAKRDFTLFEPVLDAIVQMKIKEADLIGYSASRYDALLDEFEPGMTSAELDKLLPPLAAKLKNLITKAPAPARLAAANYPLDAQEKLNIQVARALGYDLAAGRIDVSPHPFTTTFHTTDVRITTRYDESDFWVSLGSTIHEVGHALYDQGLSAEWFGTPLGEAVSLGIHESQSRSWENMVGRSRSFVAYLFPLLKENFPDIRYDEQQLYEWLNRVEPNLIRVESDEVSYNLHIVLRYELEKALLTGELKVKDLPAAWNEKVKQYLGLDVPDDAAGVLQDVHWSHGALGYFPTYSLGNLYAAQFFETYKKANPAFEDSFAKGDFSSYLKWLRSNIHAQGRRYQPLELVEKVTGETLNPDYLVKHLQTKIS